MNRVLVISPDYYHYPNALSTAFRNLGYEVDLLTYDTPVHPYSTKNKVSYKLAGKRQKNNIVENSRAKFSSEAEALFNDRKPELVFIVNGTMLDTGTVEGFRKESYVVLWLFDNISKETHSKELFSAVDRIYSFDKNDIIKIEEMGFRAGFLAQSCDTDTYKPLNLQKDIDILFVGNLYFYPNRQRLIAGIIKAFPDSNIKVIGEYKPWNKNIFKWLFREHRDIYQNRSVSPDIVNEYYNRARIVINIHREDQKNGANPRFFEICGSGAYQITDTNDFIESIMPGDEVGKYSGADELIDRISEALDSDNSSNAESARQIILSKHTVEKRIEQVIKEIQVSRLK